VVVVVVLEIAQSEQVEQVEVVLERSTPMQVLMELPTQVAVVVEQVMG
jgi:hypothetical protein